MRALFAGLCASALLFSLEAQAAPAGAEGLWLTAEHHGVVKVSSCGQSLCGTIVSGDKIGPDSNPLDVRNHDPALRSRPLRGLAIFYGLKGGPTVWKGGSVYNPVDGRTYQGSITLVDADTLKLTGCVFYPLCQSQTWTRMH